MRQDGQLVNAQFRHPFAEHWGDGTTSSSDGQNFRTGSKAESTGHINPKYGSSPGRTFYTHISDQYAPFHTKVVNVGVRDSTYVLDGLLYHEYDLRIEEHYTDTAGFTDHVFALMHLLGFRFAPRIRDLGDTKLYIPKGDAAYDALKPMIGGTLNIKHVRAHWDEILRLATSIKQGTVTASLMLSYLERATHALRGNDHAVDDALLQYLPLGWEHINLTGDYLWRSSAKIGAGKFRPLRPLQPA